MQNIKGKECGKGICQRKAGTYTARFTGKNGKRQERYFPTLPEAKNWLADVQYEEKHSIYSTSSQMTVGAWFEFWINNLIVDLAPNTKRNYRGRYIHNVQPVFGTIRLRDVKSMHCKIVLNRMEATYAGSPKTSSSYRTIPLTTRAIERGVQPIVLQKLLGHASIKTTMDRYVHVTDASLTQAVLQFESGTSLAS